MESNEINSEGKEIGLTIGAISFRHNPFDDNEEEYIIAD